MSKAKHKSRAIDTSGILVTTNLKKYLPALSLVVEKKSSIPILSQFLFSGGKVTASNLDICATLDGVISGYVETCIMARNLTSFLEYTDADLQISSKDEDGLKTILSANGTRITFPALSPKNFPATPPSSDEWAEINAADFLRLVKRARRSINKEQSRYTLNGALLQSNNGALKLISTDGHRLSVCEMPNTAEIKATLVSAPALHVISLALEAAPSNSVLVNVGETFNHYRIGPLTVTDRKIIGQFPNWESVLKYRGKDTVITVNAAEMLSALKAARIFADPRSLACRLKIDGDSIRVRSADFESGEFSRNIPAVITGKKELEVGLNVQYLIDFFLGIEGEAEMSFKDNQTAVTLRQKGKDDFTYLQMPMRF